MKKLFVLWLAAMMFVACGNDSSSNANGSDFSGGTEKVGYITQEEITYLSYLDTLNKRYYYPDKACLYDSLTNTLSWYMGDTLGIHELDTLYRYDHKRDFGYYISNDSLYMCDYNGADCTKESGDDASVYVGNNKSILGSWTFVGSIEDGIFFEIEKSYIERIITITPTKKIERVTSKVDQDAVYYAGLFCEMLYNIIDEQDYNKMYSYGNLCNEYFDYVIPKNDKYVIYNTTTAQYEDIPDTVVFKEDAWITYPGHGQAIVSINNQKINLSVTLDANGTTKTATYNGKTCTWTQKSIDITKEVCEDANPEDYETDVDYLEGKFVPMITSRIDNENEFAACGKTLGIKIE